MSYRITHENQDKRLQVQSVGDPVDEIKFTKKASINDFMMDSPIEEIDDTGMDFLANEEKRIEEEEPIYEEDDEDQQYQHQGGYESEIDPMMQGNYSDDGEPQAPEMSYEEIQQQKAFYLSQLKRLGDRGNLPSRRLGPEHSLRDIKGEVLRIRKEIEIGRGINYCRQGLMFCVSTIEMLNLKYDPAGIELEGWTAEIMADKEAYDDVFEELYEKYSNNISVGPEIKLITMVIGSAFGYHMKKYMSKQLSKASGKSQQYEEPKFERKMKGPSVDTDELLRKLNDDMSDISSVVSEVPEIPQEKEKVITVKPAKRGRKPKKKD